MTSDTGSARVILRRHTEQNVVIDNLSVFVNQFACFSIGLRRVQTSSRVGCYKPEINLNQTQLEHSKLTLKVAELQLMVDDAERILMVQFVARTFA